MDNRTRKDGLTRRDFLRNLAAGLSVPYLTKPAVNRAAAVRNDLFWVQRIPDDPYYDPAQANHHLGLDSLLYLMADNGLKFYRSSGGHPFSGPSGLIAPADIVLIKVNAQWKYRGCTNSDLIRGLIQRLLEHPDGFRGEVVIIENGQGRGSLRCDTTAAYGGDRSVRANANNDGHHFLYLVNDVFDDRRVSAYLLDPIRGTFIGDHDHTKDGYRKFERVSYPCFTTAGGNRVELKEGIWRSGRHHVNLKLINVPVLKHHDTGGSEITASLKHMYGLVSMLDGQSRFRHYGGLGETTGKMMALAATPVLNIIDATWVSHASITGFPEEATFRANQLLASQDPVAADYWAAKHILYPIDGNFRHHPDFAGVKRWLTRAMETINERGGLSDPEKGILVGRVTNKEREMRARSCLAGDFLNNVRLSLSPSGFRFTAPAFRNKTFKGFLDIAVSGAEPLPWTLETDMPWLDCAPRTGAGNATLAVVASTGGLEPGQHTGGVTVRCPGAANSPQTVSVELNLIEPRERRRRNPRLESEPPAF